MPDTCCSTDTVAERAGAKFHTSLNVTDLAWAIDFYRLRLGCEPAKQRRDYAKFELVEPPLVLSLVNALASAGFIQIKLEKLSATPHFSVGGVSLRELLISARKPGHRPQTATHTAIYLGPFASNRRLRPHLRSRRTRRAQRPRLADALPRHRRRCLPAPLITTP